VIIDSYAHVSATEYGSAELLLRQMDQTGIGQAVVAPGGMIDVRQMTRYLNGRLQPQRDVPNHVVYDALQLYGDRLHGMVGIDPTTGAAALRVMEEGFRQGCRGLQLTPVVHPFCFADSVVAEAVAGCGERGFPVYAHVLPTAGATTADYVALARRCPGTPFILGHLGLGPADADAIEWTAELDNLYLETSLGNYLILAGALARLGPHKLLFGSEFPLSHPRVELQKILLLDKTAHEAILGGNVRRLMRLDG
jgi:predicted TIM-barrel fold metal-dependent hydrolase